MKLYAITSKWGAENLLSKADRHGVSADYEAFRSDKGTFDLYRVTFDGDEEAIRETAKGYALMDENNVQA